MLSAPLKEISQEQFSNWKQDPVTIHLYAEFCAAIFDQFDDRLPEELDHGTSRAYRRDGACELLEILWDWKPQNIQAIEEGDHD